MTRFAANVPPGEIESEVAERALRRIRLYLQRHDEDAISLHVEGGQSDEVLVVPRESVHLFAQMLAHMANGDGVAVLPTHKRLTTQQAADALNVSRPYLIKLLEEGKIPHEKVGRHRRVRLDDVLDYRRKSLAEQNAAADDLSRLGQEWGT